MPQGDILIYDDFSGNIHLAGYIDPTDPQSAEHICQQHRESLISKKKLHNIPLTQAETEYCLSPSKDYAILQHDPEQKVFSQACDLIRDVYRRRLDYLRSKPYCYLTGEEVQFCNIQAKNKITFDQLAFEFLQHYQSELTEDFFWDHWLEKSGRTSDRFILYITPQRQYSVIGADVNNTVLNSIWLDFSELRKAIFAESSASPFIFNHETEHPAKPQLYSRIEEKYVIFDFPQMLPCKKRSVPWQKTWRLVRKDLLYTVKTILEKIDTFSGAIPPGVDQPAIRTDLLDEVNNALMQMDKLKYR